MYQIGDSSLHIIVYNSVYLHVRTPVYPVYIGDNLSYIFLLATIPHSLIPMMLSLSHTSTKDKIDSRVE
jgi:hypothetical protein